jgi:heme-degrading monooxygenase HmoA
MPSRVNQRAPWRPRRPQCLFGVEGRRKVPQQLSPKGVSHGDLPKHAARAIFERRWLQKVQMLFADVRRHLKPLPGFLHLTWWVHPDDPTWFNEVSFWTSKEALEDWHMTIYHKHAKAWAAQGAIMEDIITNFELKTTRLLRVCPCCGHVQDKAFDLHREQETLAEPCPTCQFNFPVMPEMANSTAVFKDAAESPTAIKEAAE